MVVIFLEDIRACLEDFVGGAGEDLMRIPSIKANSGLLGHFKQFTLALVKVAGAIIT